MHEGVTDEIAVLGGAQKPLRLRGLCPIEAQGANVIAEPNRNALRDRDRAYFGNQTIRGQLRQRIELRGAGRAVSDAGAFADKLE